MCDNEEETLMSIRELLSFLPSNNMEDAPLVPCNDDIHRQAVSYTHLQRRRPQYRQKVNACLPVGFSLS